MRVIRQVIFLFAAIVCGVVALFWFWFLYTFSLKSGWDAAGVPLPSAETAVSFGKQGAVWIGVIAVGWLIMALFFGFLHWRQVRQRHKQTQGEGQTDA